MKTDIHPQVNPVVFVDTSSGVEFITHSTLNSEEKRVIDGVEHHVIKIEISSASHPFYTGKQIFVDTARRVEKFEAKMAKVEAAAAGKVGKKAKKAARMSKKNAEEAPAPKAKKEETAPVAEATPEPTTPVETPAESTDSAK